MSAKTNTDSELQLAHPIDYAYKHLKEVKAKVARAYNVNATTLDRRCKGLQVLRAKARREQQLLTEGEEDAIVECIVHVTVPGHRYHQLLSLPPGSWS